MRTSFLRRSIIGVVFFSVALFACAKRASPPGGPPDTTAPYVDEISPSGGSVGVLPDSRIAITFSERMKKRTVETGVVVSPPCRWEKRYWEDRTYLLVPQQGLREDATYLVSVSNKVKDAHGVAMKSTFVSGFSTGDTLNAGVISGSVRWKTMDVEGAVVFLFDSGDIDSVAAFPAAGPLYVTLSGTKGLYEIPFVDTEPEYGVFALIDDNLNREYDENEKVGCYNGRLVFGEAFEMEGIDLTVCSEKLLGSIAGSVDTATVADTLSLRISAQSLEDSSLVYGAKPDNGGEFRIGCVEAGDYVIRAFHDVNLNLNLDPEDSILVELPDTFRVDSCAEPPAVTIELGDED